MNIYATLVQKAEAGETLGVEELVYLLATQVSEEAELLYQAANRVRQKTMGDGVHLRAIIEFSNICQRNCHYCGLRRDNRRLVRYRMTPTEIIQTAVAAWQLGYKTVVLQSGEDGWWDETKVCNLIAGIKAEADVAITLSIGERSRAEYEAFYAAGADRYLLKHETANPKLYAELHPDLEFAKRLECLEVLREVGFQVGSGNMVGLPGQELADIARDLLLLRELGVGMVGIGPFIPHPDTPLAAAKGGDVELTRKTVALTRLLMPYAHIPATTATGTLDPFGREKMLTAGANVVMPNVTPTAYRSAYAIYPNKICVGEDASACRGCIEGRIKGVGRYVAEGYGHVPGYETRSGS